MRRALDQFRQLGLVAVIAPRLTTQLAEACAFVGRPDEGLEILATSPDRAPGRKRVRFADIYWIEGDLHLAKSKPDPERAESCYLEAIDIAIEDNAKIPQLRASVRLAQLWLHQGQADQAREGLPVSKRATSPLCRMLRRRIA